MFDPNQYINQMYFGGMNQSLQSPQGVKDISYHEDNDMLWIDYIINANERGANKFIKDKGFVSYFAPKDKQQLKQAILKVINEEGEDAVSELLLYHPEYEAIKESVLKPKKFINATGEAINKTDYELEKIKTLKTLRLGIFILIGIIIYKHFKS